MFQQKLSEYSINITPFIFILNTSQVKRTDWQVAFWLVSLERESLVLYMVQACWMTTTFFLISEKRNITQHSWRLWVHLRTLHHPFQQPCCKWTPYCVFACTNGLAPEKNCASCKTPGVLKQGLWNRKRHYPSPVLLAQTWATGQTCLWRCTQCITPQLFLNFKKWHWVMSAARAVWLLVNNIYGLLRTEVWSSLRFPYRTRHLKSTLKGFLGLNFAPGPGDRTHWGSVFLELLLFRQECCSPVVELEQHRTSPPNTAVEQFCWWVEILWLRSVLRLACGFPHSSIPTQGCCRNFHLQTDTEGDSRLLWTSGWFYWSWNAERRSSTDR